MEKELDFLLALWNASPVLAILVIFAGMLFLLNKAGMLDFSHPNEEDPHKEAIKDLQHEMREVEKSVAILLDWKKRDDK